MTDTTRTLLLGIATGLCTALIWGSWAVVSRLGLTTGLDFYDVAALRFGVAGLVLAPVLARAGISSRGIGNVPWHAVLVMWLGAGVPYALIVFAGLGMAPASHQAMIGPSGVMLFTAALSRLVLGERFNRMQLAGMAVIVAGIATMGAQGLGGGTPLGLGHLLFVVAALLWSVFTVMARAWRVDALLSTAIVSTLSLVYLPVYFVLSGDALLRAAPLGPVLMQAAFQGLLTGVIALIFYMRTVAALGAGRAALFTALVPAMAALLAVPVLGETLSGATTAGLLLVTAGMAIAVSRGATGPGRAAAMVGQSAGLVPGSKPPEVTVRSQPGTRSREAPERHK